MESSCSTENGKKNQSLILAEIAYLQGTFGTFYPHKIVLNNSIPMVVMALYMVQPLLRYKPIFGMHPMHPPCTLHSHSHFLTQFQSIHNQVMADWKRG